MAGVPTLNTPTIVSSTQVDLSWAAVASATGYDIDDSGAIIATNIQSPYSHTGLTPGSTHTYRVRSRESITVGGGILHGVELTSANVGLAEAGLVEGDLTAYTGTLNLTNVTLTRRVINCNGNILFLGSNAHLVECIVRNADVRNIICYGSNMSITRSNLESFNGSGGEVFGIYAGDFNNDGAWPGTYVKGLQIDSLYHTGSTIGIWMDGFDPTDTATINKWYHRQSGAAGGAHRDGFTRRAGNGPVTISKSRIWLDNTPATTGSIFLQDTWSSPRSSANIGRISLIDSYMEGNGNNLTLEQGNNLTFTNNLFRPTEYGAVTRGSLTSVTQSNNFIYSSSNPPSYRGAAVTI